MNHPTFFFFLLFCCFQGHTQCDPFTYRADTEALQKHLNALNYEDEPGYVLWVVHGDSTVFRSSQGLADLSSGTPIGDHTPFYIASVAKSMTAAAVLQLWEKQALRLEDPLRQYIPDLPACMDGVQIYHLLNHTSGIPDYYDTLGEDLTDFHNAQVLEFVRSVKELEFRPGVKYAYSNTAYVLLAEVIKAVTQSSYADYLEENIFTPLGMEDSFVFEETNGKKTGSAKGYSYDDEVEQFVPNDYEGIYTVGAGGVYSSANDLKKWYVGLRQGKVLSSRSRELMWHFPMTSSGRHSWLGMGCTNETFGKGTPKLKGLKAVGSIGSLKGFRGMVNIFPDHDFAYILLSNRGSWPFEFQIGEAFFVRE